MRRIRVFLLMTASLSVGADGIRAVGYQSVEAIRAQLAVLGPLLEERFAGRTVGIPGQKHDPDTEIRFQLNQTPKELVLRAVDKAIRFGTREEKTGAIDVYCLMISVDQVHPDWAYHPILLDLLSQDDLQFPAYTGELVRLASYYLTRDTALALMALADRTPDKQERDKRIETTAALLGVNLQIDPAKPVQNEKFLSDFRIWFDRNKDRIQFDKKGEFRLAGGEARPEQKELDAEDRSRIRRNPVCVLRLLVNGIGGSEEGDIEDLWQACGAALLGPADAKLLRRAPAFGIEGQSYDMDLQAVLASARNTYPVYDAAALASIYVTIYDPDRKSQKLAREVFFQLGGVDLERVTRGEPREVRRKARELEKEMLRGGSR